MCRAGVTQYPLVHNEEDTKGTKGTEQVTEHVKYNTKGKYLYTRWLRQQWDEEDGEYHCSVHQKSVVIPAMDSKAVTQMCIGQIASQLESLHEKNHADGVNAQSDLIWGDDDGSDADVCD